MIESCEIKIRDLILEWNYILKFISRWEMGSIIKIQELRYCGGSFMSQDTG